MKRIRRVVGCNFHWGGKTSIRIEYGCSHTREVDVDPAPAHSHDIKDVRTALAHVEERAPLPPEWRPTYHLLDRDVLQRWNGMTFLDHNYQKRRAGIKKKKYRPVTNIVLAGKFIPPHPAVTRYLVAHEYGHVVAHVIAYLSHIEDSGDPDTNLAKEYAVVRGVETPTHYGPETWSGSPGELLACDFRVLVAGIESDYWPHPAVKHPFDMPKLRKWWGAKMRIVDQAIKHPHRYIKD